MKEIFENYIETSFDGFHQATFKFLQFEKNYRRFFPAGPAKTLDIGIGRGEMLTCMRDWGMEYEGVDISVSTINFCQGLGLKCSLTDDTIGWLEGRKKTYDVVTMLDVIEHVPRDNVIAMLAAINASLRDDGKLIVQVPNLQAPFGYLHHFNDFTHVSGFVEHSLSQVLIASGFRKFLFYGFNELVENNASTKIKAVLRYPYWKIIRVLRAINSSPNPKILNPVFFCVASK